MDTELLRLSIVYGHLIACAVAIGSILISDFGFVKQLLLGDPRQGPAPQHMENLQRTVTWALLALWCTGALIAAVDVAAKGMTYFDNPKLQAKIIIVCLLTLNGILLHNAVLPRLKKAKSLLNLPWSQRWFATFIGSFSAVSWLYAAFLGVGRSLSWKFPLGTLMFPYAALIAGAFAGMLALLAWAQQRTARDVRPSATLNGMAVAY